MEQSWPNLRYDLGFCLELTEETLQALVAVFGSTCEHNSQIHDRVIRCLSSSSQNFTTVPCPALHHSILRLQDLFLPPPLNAVLLAIYKIRIRFPVRMKYGMLIRFIRFRYTSLYAEHFRLNIYLND
jgi:hypothetical protein